MKKPLRISSERLFLFIKGAPTYFPTVKTAVSLALKSLASVFEMGTGVSSSLKAHPNWVYLVTTGIYRDSINIKKAQEVQL